MEWNVREFSAKTGAEIGDFPRITFNTDVMGGKPCVRGMRVTVDMIVGMTAAGHKERDLLKLYPYLEVEDIQESLAYAAWRNVEIDSQPARQDPFRE